MSQVLRPSIVIGLAIAMANLLLSAGSARAAGVWFFETDISAYPPIYAPPLNPKRGPVWTPNGWSYPQWGEVQPVPYWGPLPDDRYRGPRRPVYDPGPVLK